MAEGWGGDSESGAGGIIFVYRGETMRILVGITEGDLSAIRRMCGVLGISRAEVICRTIKAFVASQETMTLEDGFGLWGGVFAEDGVEFQRKMKLEWPWCFPYSTPDPVDGTCENG
jgi:hypothetical protein